jgi:hypothetical protein
VRGAQSIAEWRWRECDDASGRNQDHQINDPIPKSIGFGPFEETS